MSQQTNTNTVSGSNNHNLNIGRDRKRSRGGFGGSGGYGGQGECSDNTCIAKSSVEGKLKDRCLYKLTITEGLHGVTPPKKINDILSILGAEKGYKYLDNVIYNNQELGEATHMPVYLNALRQLGQIFVKIDTVDPNGVVDASGSRPVIKVVTKMTRIFNENLGKQLTLEYEPQRRLKQTERNKTMANKKKIMTLICRQCDKETLTKLALGFTYDADCNDRNLVNFLDLLRLVCY